MCSFVEVVLPIVTVVTVVLGCSPPEGGYQPPTPADNVFYSKHVVVGTVLELITPDPMYADTWGNTTYGAKVKVRCTYKGGVLGDTITIGGAGFIPGMCTSKHLEANKKYILFLAEKRQNELFEQVEPAEPYSKIMQYLGVCNLEMKYPMENGMVLHRESCPHASELDSCKNHTTAPTVTSKPLNQPAPVAGAGSQESKNADSGASGTRVYSCALQLVSALLVFIVYI